MSSAHSDAVESAKKGDVEAIKKLLQRSDVKEWLNKEDKDGWTPLHGACYNGHLEVMKLLESSGANVNCTDKSGWTPLHLACLNGHLEVMKFLVSSGGFVDTNIYGESAIGTAFRVGHVSVVEEFIAMELKGQLCYQGGDGGSLLHVVCKERKVKMDLVKKLLERGLDATKRDQNGKLPADYVSDYKKKAEVSRLIGSVTSKKEPVEEEERAEREKQRVEAEERERRRREEQEKQEAAAARQREAEERARLEREKEAEAQVLVGRETLDLFNARLCNPDLDDRERLLTQQQRQGAEISRVREVLDSIDDKLKCLSPVDREEQRLIRTTPALSEYMQALQRHTHESLLIADALSAGLLDQTASLESDAVEVKAFRVLAKLCSGLPLIPAVLSGVAGGLNHLHQAKEKGGYSLLLKLVSGGAVERSLFVEKLCRALTVTLRSEIIATVSAKHNTDAMEGTRCFLAKVKGVVRKMKAVAREKVAALDEALAEGLLPSETKAELLACGHVTDMLEYVFAGELADAEGDEEEVVNRLVRHVAGSERVRLDCSNQNDHLSPISSSAEIRAMCTVKEDVASKSEMDEMKQMILKLKEDNKRYEEKVSRYEDKVSRYEEKVLRYEEKVSRLEEENKRTAEKAERSEGIVNQLFQGKVLREGQQMKTIVQGKKGVTIDIRDSQSELALAEMSTAQITTEQTVQGVVESHICLEERLSKVERKTAKKSVFFWRRKK